MMSLKIWKCALLAAVASTFLLTACSDDEDAATEASAEPSNGTSATSNATGTSTSNGTTSEDALTWYRDTKPILDAHCVSCHSDGGGAPFVLDSYEAFKPLAQSAMASIDEGTMPPWLPDPDCREFVGQRIMPPDQIEILREWIALEMPMGDPNDAPPETQAQELNFEPTHTVPIAEPYTPNAELPDDYRCFILDFEFEEDMYLTGSSVIPDAKALVHHVLVYSMDPDSVELITTADAEEAGPGYTCFGAPWPQGSRQPSLASLPNLVGGWVPGQTPNIAAPDTSTRIVKGSKLVMQVHYNTLAGPTSNDTTALQMDLQTEPTSILGYTRPLVIVDLDIPAGDPSSVHYRDYRNYSDRTISINRMAAHMHLLGKGFRSEITRTDGSKECVIDIPQWDFNWQQSYRMENYANIDIAPGESIALQCTFDNSPANQPVINGEVVEPRDVGWGEGTLDEMCLLYLTFVEPFEEPPPPPDPNAGVCDGVKQCQDNCPEDASSAECLLGCEGLSEDCLFCTVESMFSCTPCAPNFLRLIDCFTDCAITTGVLKGQLSSCLKTECGEGYEELVTCINPVIESGACNEALLGCGIER